jgi:hypothetical protein
MRRLVVDGVWSFSAMVLLLFVLTVLDPRVRDELTWRGVRRGEDAVDTGTRVRSFVSVTYSTAKDKVEDNQALMFFTVVGGVLLLAMLRT